MTPLEWPPNFTLRHSQRARSVRLQICPHRGLQLIVPRRFNSKNIDAILQEHRTWIERTWLRLKPDLHPPESELLPQEIRLLGINETWKIQYDFMEVNRLYLKTHAENKTITLQGKIENKTMVRSILLKWLRKIAHEKLIPQLIHLSEKTGLTFTRATIRNTQTRWGSCSQQKNISLNCKLLFLPPELVEHVLLHELCHTVYFDHSKKFWRLLQQLSPACHDLRKQLKQANKFVPFLFSI